jgi:hypothetical protein
MSESLRQRLEALEWTIMVERELDDVVWERD